MVKPVLAVDVDECLVAFLDGYAAWLAGTGRETFRVAALAGFGAAAHLGLDPRAGKALEMEFLAAVGVEITPMPGAVTAIAALAERYELHAVTARVASIAGDATRACLEHHFGDAFAGVHLQQRDLDCAPTPKGEICARLGAVALIDDSPANLATLTDPSAGVLHGEWPWTRSVHGPWPHTVAWDAAVAPLGCGQPR